MRESPGAREGPEKMWGAGLGAPGRRRGYLHKMRGSEFALKAAADMILGGPGV